MTYEQQCEISWETATFRPFSAPQIESCSCLETFCKKLPSSMTQELLTFLCQLLRTIVSQLLSATALRDLQFQGELIDQVLGRPVAFDRTRPLEEYQLR